jgi:hypothetical protein
MRRKSFCVGNPKLVFQLQKRKTIQAIPTFKYVGLCAKYIFEIELIILSS